MSGRKIEHALLISHTDNLIDGQYEAAECRFCKSMRLQNAGLDSAHAYEDFMDSVLIDRIPVIVLQCICCREIETVDIETRVIFVSIKNRNRPGHKLRNS